jgi:hypothetical protein
MFHTPEKKKGSYVSRVTDKKGKPFVVNVQNSKVLAIHKLENENGHMVKLWIPKDSYAHEVMSDLDSGAIQNVISHNEEWFQNALSQQHIYDFFRPCLDQETCVVLASSVKVPRSITFRGKALDNFDELTRAMPRELRSLLCSCSLEAQGLYFYPKKFGVRWIIRTIELHDKAQIDEPEALLNHDKEEVEEFWRNELSEARVSIAQDVKVLEEKIAKLRDYEGELELLMKEAEKEEGSSSKWNDCLDSLKSKIFEYKCGRL